MDNLNKKPDITYCLQVKDHKLFTDADSDGDDFEDNRDFRYCLNAALDWVIGDYELERLFLGEISNITIVLSADDLKG